MFPWCQDNHGRGCDLGSDCICSQIKVPIQTIHWYGSDVPEWPDWQCVQEDDWGFMRGSPLTQQLGADRAVKEARQGSRWRQIDLWVWKQLPHTYPVRRLKWCQWSLTVSAISKKMWWACKAASDTWCTCIMLKGFFCDEFLYAFASRYAILQYSVMPAVPSYMPIFKI